MNKRRRLSGRQQLLLCLLHDGPVALQHRLGQYPLFQDYRSVLHTACNNLGPTTSCCGLKWCSVRIGLLRDLNVRELRPAELPTKKRSAYQPSLTVECGEVTLKRRIYRLQKNRDRGTSDDVLEDGGASRLRHQGDYFLSGLCRRLRDAH